MADTKISALTAATAITDDDLLVVVDDPAGTPATKKITALNAKSYFGGGSGTPTVVAANTGTAYTVDSSAGDAWRLTLTGNCTFTFTNLVAGKTIAVRLAQDATGSRTVTWPAAVKWPNATAPFLPSTAGAVSVLTFVSFDGTEIIGGLAGNNYG